MSNVNTVAVSGNLVADPELKTLPSGTTVAELRMATNRSRKTDDGYVDEASFFSISAFGKFAELIGRKLRKADSVTVTGRLEEQRWEKDGQKRSKVVIIANEIDSPGFFKKDEDVAPLATAEAGASTTAPDPTGAGDDIPF
jgi:single-strand DNA-binding protein